jgi:hypothetical protein
VTRQPRRTDVPESEQPRKPVWSGSGELAADDPRRLSNEELRRRAIEAERVGDPKRVEPCKQ